MELWQLQQMKGLPLEVKIRKTQERIKEWYEYWNGQVYISFSGGKDSTVLLDIARKIFPDIEGVFVDTGLEYPEIRQFVKTFNNITWVRPKMNFKEVIENYGYPVISKEVSECVSQAQKSIKSGGLRYTYRLKKLNGELTTKDGKKSRYNMSKWKFLLDAPFKISNKCCDIMKKQPCKKYEKETGNKAIIGMLTEESELRMQGWLKSGCNGFEDKRPTSNPLSFWTEQDVYQYILKNDLQLASCYGEIVEGDQLIGQTVLEGCMSNLTTTKCKRTGCMFCMFGIMYDGDNNRFQMMKETHPKQYDYCINKLGLGDVLDYINVDY